jgi:hypothetical protein
MEQPPHPVVQNELDAHATETRIRFEGDRLVCQGNSVCVDANGWKRLSYITGTGKEAPRKHNRIGVKNRRLENLFGGRGRSPNPDAGT